MKTVQSNEVAKTVTFLTAQVLTSQVVTSHQTTLSDIELLKAKKSWRDRESREFYVEAAVEQGLAFQIRVNREKRGWSQKQLARLMGTGQSAISRMEDPNYGAHSLQQLIKLAHVFDCSLIVKLAGFSKLARESRSLTERHLFAPSYAMEMDENGN